MPKQSRRRKAKQSAAQRNQKGPQFVPGTSAAAPVGFYLDENLSGSAARELREKGFNVTTTSEAGLRGRPIAEKVRFATEKQRILVTANRDFAKNRDTRAGHLGCVIGPKRMAAEEILAACPAPPAADGRDSGKQAASPETLDRDTRVLRHLGRYYLSIRPVLAELFFDGNASSCGNVIKRLAKHGLLQTRPKGLGNFSYYQLTATAAQNHGFDVYRAQEPNSAQALWKHFRILWACFMGRQRRHRLEKHELQWLFDDGPPSGEHCAARGRTPEGFHLFQVRVPGETIDDRNLVSSIQETMNRLDGPTKVGSCLRQGRYRFLVLVETDWRQQRLNKAFKERKIKQWVKVETAPGAETLQTVLSQRREGKGEPRKQTQEPPFQE